MEPKIKNFVLFDEDVMPGDPRYLPSADCAENECGADEPSGYGCTREKGHAMPHAAHGELLPTNEPPMYATWEDAE